MGANISRHFMPGYYHEVPPGSGEPYVETCERLLARYRGHNRADFLNKRLLPLINRHEFSTDRVADIFAQRPV
jgi:hypothetical protein